LVRLLQQLYDLCCPPAAVLSVCVGSVVGQQPCGSSFITTIVTADASTATQTLPCNVPNNLRLTQATFAWQWEKLRANLSVERQLPLTMHTATQELTSSIYTLQSVDCKTTGIYEARYLENTLNQIPSCKYSCRFIVEVQEDRQHSLVGGFSMFRKFHVVDNVLTWEQSQIILFFFFFSIIFLLVRSYPS